MKIRNQGKTQTEAAAQAGLSERTAQRLDAGQHNSQQAPKSRGYTTRQDPLADVWENELIPMLKNQPDLLPITLFEHLQDKYPGEYDKSHRTLQRRIKQWHALHGKNQEIIFRQQQQPGQQALVDFTVLKGIVILIAGVVLSFRLFHFRLAYSKWSYLKIVQGGESYTALTEGTSEALKRMGAVPAELRTDSLSAAFRNLTTDEVADITERYQAFCCHYGMKPTRNNRGVAHENGAVESPHGHLKRRIVQQLKMHFPKVTDSQYCFDSIDEFQCFIDAIVTRHNRRNESLLREELALMAPLPSTKGVDYTEEQVRVSTTSTINMHRVIYSVPSRLIGERLRLHLYDERLECYLGSAYAITLERLHPKGNQRLRQIDYRHLIASLARKPMAFYHAELRDDILPNDHWRQLWLQCNHLIAPRQACYLIVGALELAATHDNETEVATVLQALLNNESEPSLLALQKLLGLASRTLPETAPQQSCQHDLVRYDDLLKPVEELS
ncbi:MAG: IS21 family transposase [Pseudomonadales bacterium]